MEPIGKPENEKTAFASTDIDPLALEEDVFGGRTSVVVLRNPCFTKLLPFAAFA
jgi:hypothetical protein